MGFLCSKLLSLYENVGGNHGDARIVMVGLDDAGKTSILYRVKLNEKPVVIPTLGYNVETLSPVHGVTFTVWDLCACIGYRGLWCHFYSNAKGILYVINSTDRERMDETKEELQRILCDDQLRDVPLVVIANKQDLANAMKPSEITARLELEKIRGRRWHVQGTSALTGDGILEAMEVLSHFVKEFNNRPRP